MLGGRIVEACVHAALLRLWEVGCHVVLLLVLRVVVRVVLGRLLRHPSLHHHARVIVLLLLLMVLCGDGGETAIALLIEKYTVVLSVRLRLRWVLLQVLVIHRLLAQESKVHLPFNILCLLPRHELLGVLVRVGQLAASLLVQVLLRTAVAMGRGLAEGRVGVGPTLTLFLI